jgi:uncharacterized repeat protein (TIGR01451 family)
MRCLNQSLAIALGFQLLFSAQPSSAQVISRLKDRKQTNKESQAAASQGNSTSGAPDASVVPDSARLKPIPLASAAARAKPSTKAPSPNKADQVNALASIPQVSIETVGPAEVNLGRRAKYTITIRNEGDSPTQGLILHAMIPAGAELVETEPKPEVSGGQLEYLLGEIPAKSSRRLQIDLIARRHGAMDLKTYVSVSTAASAAIQVRCPDVAVKVHGPSEAIVGDTVMFKATITNTGDGTAENICIAQLLPARTSEGEVAQAQAVLEHVQSRIERLLPGQSEEIELPAVATSVGLMRANIVVKASDGLEAQTAVEVRVRQPTIEMKTVGPESRLVQRSGGYVIIVSNTGDIAAEGVVVTAAIPKGLEVVGIEKRTSFDKKMGTLTWNLAKIDAGATESLKFQVKALEEGEHKVQVAAIGDRKLNAETSHVIQVSGKADLSLSVDDTPGPIEVGGQATYEIRVKNTGTKSVQNVSLRCNLPRGLEILASPEFKLDGMNLEFASIDQLAVGDERVLQFTATGREPGDQMVRFTLQSDNLSREITAETSTFFFKADK